MQPRLPLAILLPLGGILACHSPPAMSAGAASSIDGIARAAGHAFVDSLRLAQHIPGMSVAVVQRGRVRWLDTIGVADLASRRAVRATTMFRVGSVSKLITAFTAARIAQSRALDLDAPARRYLPELPLQDSSITPRELLGHLGGIHHYGRGSYINRTAYPSVRASVAKFASDSLIATPGTKYFYSSYGFVLLGAAMEAATGAPFAALVHDNTLQPIGLSHTMIDVRLPPGVDTASLYDRESDGSVSPSPAMDLSDRIPAGGFVSTALDLARFGMASIDGRLLDASMRSAMFTPQKTASGQAVPVGIGWALGRDDAGRRIAFHGGDAIGGRAFLLVYPDDGLVVAMAANLGFASFAEREAKHIGELFLESPR